MINNPIIKGFNPDPVICRQGDDYYIATSTFEWFPGVRIYHSNNLNDWTLVAQPLSRVSQLDLKGIPNSGGVWAPCLSYHDELFWLVYTNVKSVESPWKCGDNFLVTAQNIEGPWSEPIQLTLGGFDPSLFHDQSGRKYLIYREWGPRHHSNPHNNIVLQEYFHEQQQLSRERHTVFTGTHRRLTEAPHLYFVDDYYYLLLAEGGTRYEHAVTVLRSQTIDGPFELHPDETILTMVDKPESALQKAGHGSMIQTHENEWYMVFLVGRPLIDNWIADHSSTDKAFTIEGKARGYCPLGRETAIDKVEWRGGWPYLLGGAHAKAQVTPPTFYRKSNALDDNFIDRFETDCLHPEWQTLRIPFSEEIGKLETKPSTLRLYGREPLISQFTQSTVGHRWKHFSFDAVTKVAFQPRHEHQNAGLACFYNTQNWIYCFIDFDESIGSRSLKIIQVDNGEARYFYYEQPIEIADAEATVSLKVSVRGPVLTFSYSFDTHSWFPLDATFDAWKLSDDYVDGKGFFTGAFVCLHCSDLSHEGIYADFHHFEYLPTEPHLAK